MVLYFFHLLQIKNSDVPFFITDQFETKLLVTHITHGCFSREKVSDG